ncbi:MAG: response regulator transcription factor [Thermodesulfobacteriota bacterium]
MNGLHILVAEDDKHILAGLIDALESEGYRVTPAADGKAAVSLLETEKFDLVILDVMMPGRSGYDVCKTIRATDQDLPVMMLTAKGEEIDKVVGFELGADDYVTKPFGVRELLARIAALLRRSRRGNEGVTSRPPAPPRFTIGKALVDALEFKVRVGTRTFDLSTREVRLLQIFYANPNKVLSREQLLNEVWGITYYGTTRTLDQHIAQLRKKLDPDIADRPVIKTIHGVGYRYESE